MKRENCAIIFKRHFNIFVTPQGIGIKINGSHCIKYHNFTQFPGAEILWKGSVSTVLGDSPETTLAIENNTYLPKKYPKAA